MNHHQLDQSYRKGISHIYVVILLLLVLAAPAAAQTQVEVDLLVQRGRQQFQEARKAGTEEAYQKAEATLGILHLWVLLYEERSLKRRFGAPYERYCQRVSRWIPGLPRSSGVTE
ncbi:MAG TPA: hypothetical protein VK582_11695 [Pyrinomonadaceae bacterium]|nr:hypothetical protein [Pyrinomonadaceae bacterium]